MSFWDTRKKTKTFKEIGNQENCNTMKRFKPLLSMQDSALANQIAGVIIQKWPAV